MLASTETGDRTMIANWLNPSQVMPDKLTDYVIWNAESNQQEIGHMNRHGIWESYMSLDPVVTRYHEMIDDPQGV